MALDVWGGFPWCCVAGYDCCHYCDASVSSIVGTECVSPWVFRAFLLQSPMRLELLEIVSFVSSVSLCGLSSDQFLRLGAGSKKERPGLNRASFLVDRFRAPLRVDSQFCCPTQFWRFQRSNVISTSATRCWCSYAAQSHRVVQILFGFLFCSPDCRSPLVSCRCFSAQISHLSFPRRAGFRQALQSPSSLAFCLCT